MAMIENIAPLDYRMHVTRIVLATFHLRLQLPSQ